MGTEERSKRTVRSHYIGAYVTKEEFEKIVLYAEKSDRSVSGLIRHVINALLSDEVL